MAALVVSPRAEEDLEEIWFFIAQQDPTAADRLIAGITYQFDHLLSFPEAGRTRHDLLVNLRCFPVKNYLIFYQQTDDGVEVFRVLHGARDLEQVFDELVGEAE